MDSFFFLVYCIIDSPSDLIFAIYLPTTILFFVLGITSSSIVLVVTGPIILFVLLYIMALGILFYGSTSLGKAYSLFLTPAFLTGILIAATVTPFVGVISSLTYIWATVELPKKQDQSKFWVLILGIGLAIHVLLSPADGIGLVEVMALGASFVIIVERNTAPFYDQFLSE